ncbi:MAG TPA: DUF1569 domain-containing protein [Candidatus Angelobacter sp.]|nr:DUF1569 domain-containing protein [Candidatus Angelobacter sp.]
METAASKPHSSLQPISEAIDRAVDGMTDEQLAWHPEGKWSSAQILEHLSLAYSLSAKRLNAVLQEGKPNIRSRTFREQIGVAMVIRFGYILPGRKSPEAIHPKNRSPREVIAALPEYLSELGGVLEKCESQFGGDCRIMVHPILGPLSVRQWRRFHQVHTLHHLGQIKARRESLNR